MSKPTAVAVSVSKQINARPEVIYDIITDITRMPEFSTENVAGEWLDGATGPVVGARFKGSNVLGSAKWSTKPTVIAADRGRQFVFQVPGKSGATWTYQFEPVAGGTVVTESMRQERPSPWPIRFLQRRAGVTDRAAHLETAMITTLDRLAIAAQHDQLANI